MRRAGLIISVVAVGLAGAWAIGPLPPPRVDRAATRPVAEPGTHTLAALDTVAFRAPLWVAPPAPPPAPPPPVAPPPLRLQLLAVIHEEETYRAMLYDPDADRIIVAREGEVMDAGRVERITAAGVEIRGSAGTRTLALRPDQSGRTAP